MSHSGERWVALACAALLWKLERGTRSGESRQLGRGRELGGISGYKCAWCCLLFLHSSLVLKDIRYKTLYWQGS